MPGRSLNYTQIIHQSSPFDNVLKLGGGGEKIKNLLCHSTFMNGKGAALLLNFSTASLKFKMVCTV